MTQSIFVHLMMTDGRCIASNHRGAFGLTRLNQWPWIVDRLVNETGCDPDQVHCIETDDGDRIAIGGQIAAYLVEQ